MQPKTSSNSILESLITFSSYWSSAQVLGEMARAAGVHMGDADLRTLYTIHRKAPVGGAQPSWVAAELGVSRSTMSKSLGRLAQAGLAERHSTQGDGRVVVLRLTEEGQRIHEYLVDAADRMVADALEGIDEVHVEPIITLLTRLSRSVPAPLPQNSNV